MIVHLNGMPGVGKLTIAKILADKLSARLIDNHSLIDVVTRMYERGSEAYLTEMERMRRKIYEEIEQSSKAVCYIFTNALSDERPEDRMILDTLAHCAIESDHVFVQVLLVCDLEENKKRLVAESRKGTGKLMDTNQLETLQSDYSLYHPEGAHRLIIDNTGISAQAAAEQIIRYIRQVDN
jgi:broad-specificity NMP kinase